MKSKKTEPALVWWPTAAELETAETYDLPDWILAINARADARG